MEQEIITREYTIYRRKQDQVIDLSSGEFGVDAMNNLVQTSLIVRIRPFHVIEDMIGNPEFNKSRICGKFVSRIGIQIRIKQKHIVTLDYLNVFLHVSIPKLTGNRSFFFHKKGSKFLTMDGIGLI